MQWHSSHRATVRDVFDRVARCCEKETLHLARDRTTMLAYTRCFFGGLGNSCEFVAVV